jgi:hypothetical protein
MHVATETMEVPDISALKAHLSYAAMKARLIEMIANAKPTLT